MDAERVFRESLAKDVWVGLENIVLNSTETVIVIYYESRIVTLGNVFIFTA